MKQKLKIVVVVLSFFGLTTSCTGESINEIEKLYIQSTEGEVTNPKDPKD